MWSVPRCGSYIDKVIPPNLGADGADVWMVEYTPVYSGDVQRLFLNICNGPDSAGEVAIDGHVVPKNKCYRKYVYLHPSGSKTFSEFTVSAKAAGTYYLDVVVGCKMGGSELWSDTKTITFTASKRVSSPEPVITDFIVSERVSPGPVKNDVCRPIFTIGNSLWDEVAVCLCDRYGITRFILVAGLLALVLLGSLR